MREREVSTRSEMCFKMLCLGSQEVEDDRTSPDRRPLNSVKHHDDDGASSKAEPQSSSDVPKKSLEPAGTNGKVSYSPPKFNGGKTESPKVPAMNTPKEDTLRNSVENTGVDSCTNNSEEFVSRNSVETDKGSASEVEFQTKAANNSGGFTAKGQTKATDMYGGSDETLGSKDQIKHLF